MKIQWLQTGAEFYYQMGQIEHTSLYWIVLPLLFYMSIYYENSTFLINRFHVMWPSDSKPLPNCITKLDK